MKKYYMFIAVAISVISGCATTIESYKVSDRDKEEYETSAITKEDYANTPFVLETRGDGAIACVTLGKNQNVTKGTKFVFYKVNSTVIKRYKIPFAEGRVFKFGPDTAWVEVKGGSSAGVKKGHLANIAKDQSYTLGEKLIFPPRFFKKK